MNVLNKSYNCFAEACATTRDMCSIFYFAEIENNGKFEGFANWFLSPNRNLFSGRRVTINQHSYSNKFSPSNRLTNSCEWIASQLNWPGMLISGVIWTVTLVAGTIFKLAAWLFVPGTFAKNYKLLCLQKKERKEFKDWSFDCKYIDQIAFKKDKRPNFNPTQLDTFPEEILLMIFEKLPVKDLVRASEVASVFYITSRYFQERIVTELKNKLVSNSFPERIREIFSNRFDLAQIPQIKLPAHRISDDPYDCRIEGYGAYGADIQKIKIPLKAMKGSVVKWGLDPIPFIAVKVLYRQEVHGWFSSKIRKLGYKLRLYKTLHREEKGIITIYKSGENKSEDQHWSVNLPWLSYLAYKGGYYAPMPIPSFIQNLVEGRQLSYDTKSPNGGSPHLPNGLPALELLT